MNVPFHRRMLVRSLKVLTKTQDRLSHVEDSLCEVNSKLGDCMMRLVNAHARATAQEQELAGLRKHVATFAPYDAHAHRGHMSDRGSRMDS